MEVLYGLTNAPPELFSFYHANSGKFLARVTENFLGSSVEIYEDNTLVLSGTIPTDAEEWAEDMGIYLADLTLIESDFAAFDEEKSYSVTIDGTAVTARLLDGLLTNLPSDLYIAAATKDQVSGVMLEVGTMTISRTITKTVKRYDTKLLPDDLLPKTAARKSDVVRGDAATLAAARKWQNETDELVEVAGSRANAAYNLAAGALPNLIFDKVRGGFKRSEDGILLNGTNCPSVFYSFLSFDEGLPAMGLLGKGHTIAGWTIYGVAFDSLGRTYEIGSNTIDDNYGSGFKIKRELVDTLIKSSTSGSTKTFKITVDDSGTLSATEVT